MPMTARTTQSFAVQSLPNHTSAAGLRESKFPCVRWNICRKEDFVGCRFRMRFSVGAHIARIPPVHGMVNAKRQCAGPEDVRNALCSDPCRLVRQVKKIPWLEPRQRALGPLPPCVAGESDSDAVEKQVILPCTKPHPRQNLIHLPDEPAGV